MYIGRGSVIVGHAAGSEKSHSRVSLMALKLNLNSYAIKWSLEITENRLVLSYSVLDVY